VDAFGHLISVFVPGLVGLPHAARGGALAISPESVAFDEVALFAVCSGADINIPSFNQTWLNLGVDLYIVISVADCRPSSIAPSTIVHAS
jgi:hypothetical protein